MSDGRAQFRLAGVPVRVEPVFWVIVVLFGFRARTGWSLVIWVAIVFLSILVHEFGHAFAYRCFGARATITLTAFAGLTHGPRLARRWRRIVVSLAGPLSALVLLGLPARALFDGDFGAQLRFDVLSGQTWDGWYYALSDLVFVNVWWSLLNLVPVRPLDGGNVVSEIIGDDAGRMLSILVAGGGALYAFSIGERYLAFFALLFAFMNYSELQSARGGPRDPRPFRVEPPRGP